jgi:Arc/MetJ-type ribon-helix-helix transcriptional regulator
MVDMKERISATVETDLIKWVDQQVETQKYRNRSHAIEVALMKLRQEA